MISYHTINSTTTILTSPLFLPLSALPVKLISEWAKVEKHVFLKNCIDNAELRSKTHGKYMLCYDYYVFYR